MYKTAFDLATKRAQDTGDPKAMTMLGELYANALGVKRDYTKAADWYKRAADGGDREGMFALAMLRLAGRGGPVNHEEAAKMLASSAKLGNPKAAYNLALLYLDTDAAAGRQARGGTVSRRRRRRQCGGAIRAGDLLQGRHRRPKRHRKGGPAVAGGIAGRQCRCRGRIRHRALNGTGTPRNEAAAVALLRKAAKQNSPIAQNRLARVLLTGQGAPMDKIEGAKWHLVAKTAGKGDPLLDEALAELSPEDRASAEAAARRWLGTK